MQGLMLILEIVVVVLVAIEVYIRFTGRRKGKKPAHSTEFPLAPPAPEEKPVVAVSPSVSATPAPQQVVQ